MSLEARAMSVASHCSALMLTCHPSLLRFHLCRSLSLNLHDTRRIRFAVISRYPWVGLNACDGVSVVALSLVGIIYLNNWLCVPLLIVLLTALVAFSGEPRPRSAELFLVRLFCVVLVAYPLGSALPWGPEAILTGDALSWRDVIVLIKFISPIGIGVGFICGCYFYFAVKVRQQIALLIAEFVAIGYAVAAILQWFQGSASV